MDPYVVLGVDRAATPDEIDAAFARRSRLHDPADQSTTEDRAAADRYHAELADAYQTLLGTAPPATVGDNGIALPGRGGTDPARRGTAVRSTDRRPSAGRDALVVLGTLVGAYVVLQLPVALGFGFGGLIIGLVGAVALVVVVLMHERRRRA